MQIAKRNGTVEIYDNEKILSAIRGAFKSVSSDESNPLIIQMAEEIKNEVQSMHKKGITVQVETIQDIVEKTLIEHNFYAEVKSFILYRVNHAKMRFGRSHIADQFTSFCIDDVLKAIQNEYNTDVYSFETLFHKFVSLSNENLNEAEKLSALIKSAVELTTQEAPKWENIAARLLMFQFSLQLTADMKKRGITCLYDKIQYLEDQGLYGAYIRQNYTKAEIDYFETLIDNSRNNLFNYSGLDLLLRRYVIRTRKHIPLETPQEMFMGIAMHLALNEKKDRTAWVLRIYTILSKLQVTVATPTLSNARKPYHQLSSCFIDTVPDSLEGIYRSIDNFAQVSKFGGGMGLYFGKVRAIGSPIRGFQGAAGGVIRWIKLANDTAVAVDQLGVRQGSVAVYLDVWHKDIPEFLQLRTNNGDDRMKAHDVFPAVCYPDLFWKNVRDNIDSTWYLMCPHEILTVKGYALEDFYGDQWEDRYNECIADNRISKREIPLKDLVRLILKSAVETGTPFAFNRDIVNQANPNPHQGIIYSSNLCTEIMQNMSAIKTVRKVVTTEATEENPDGETVLVEVTKPGDFVVCNLASLVLGNINTDNDKELEFIIETVVRALDNVIDLNFYPIQYAEITNKRYRSIGLGTSGYHHLLAKKGIKWESDEHLTYIDNLFERINY
ncbi:MAG: ribonucleoside-diphosphate reductase subunit alpha, partial [Treponemataceae bacterium]